MGESVLAAISGRDRSAYLGLTALSKVMNPRLGYDMRLFPMPFSPESRICAEAKVAPRKNDDY